MNRVGRLVGVSVDVDVIMSISTLWVETRWTCTLCGATNLKFRNARVAEYDLVGEGASEALLRCAEFLLPSS